MKWIRNQSHWVGVGLVGTTGFLAFILLALDGQPQVSSAPASPDLIVDPAVESAPSPPVAGGPSTEALPTRVTQVMPAIPGLDPLGLPVAVPIAPADELAPIGPTPNPGKTEGLPVLTRPSLPEIDLPRAIPLLPPDQEKCERAMGVYKARLRARERALEQARLALDEEKRRVLEMQAIVDERWARSQSDFEIARSLVSRSQENCKGAPPSPIGLGDIDLGLDRVDPKMRLKRIVDIVKAMKPAAAARVIERWNDPLAAKALAQLSPRVSSKILAQLPEELSAKLTVAMIRGNQ